MFFCPAKEQYNSDHGRVYFCLVTKGSILSMSSIDMPGIAMDIELRYHLDNL